MGVSKGAPIEAAIGALISSSSSVVAWCPTLSKAAAKFASADADPGAPAPALVKAPSTPPRLSTPKSNAFGRPSKDFA